MVKPDKPEPSRSDERDERGRFLPGNQTAKTGGRPRGVDFRRVVHEHSEREGVPVELAVWAIYTSMLKRARDGDTQAAKLILDRICDLDPQKLEIVHAGIIGHAEQPTDTERIENAQRAIRLLTEARGEDEQATG